MSPTFTLRLPEDLLRKMRDRRDINWAELLRETIRETLNEPVLPATIENLITSLRDSGEWEMLMALYLKADLLSEDYVIRNLEVIYPGKAVEIVGHLDSMLRDRGIKPDLRASFDGRFLRDLAKDGLLAYGVYDKFERDVRENISKESEEVKDAIKLLSQYFISEPHRWDTSTLWVEPHGFMRTLGIILGSEDVTGVIQQLIKIGVAFQDYYSSKAYSHEMIRGADYARPIFVEYALEKEKYFDFGFPAELANNPDFRTFLKWFFGGSYGGDVKAVLEYEEDKAKEEFKGSKPLDEVVADLIRRGIIIIDYWPHRRRTGKRRSMPPYWVYKFTPVVRRKFLPYLLVKCISEM